MANAPTPTTDAPANSPLIQGLLLAVGLFAASLPTAALVVADRWWLAALVVVTAVLAAWRLGDPWRAAARLLSAGGAVGVIWGAVAYPTVEQSTGPLTASPSIGELTAGGPQYRRGRGSVIVDLRALPLASRAAGQAAPELTVRARADTGDVVVALPERACVRVVVDHRRLAPRPVIFDKLAWPLGLRTQGKDRSDSLPDQRGGQLTSQEFANELRRKRDGEPPLIAYGQPRWGGGRWTRETAQPPVATIRIKAAAGGQVLVRNFPTRPLDLRPEGRGDDLAWGTANTRTQPRADDHVENAQRTAAATGPSDAILSPPPGETVPEFRRRVLAHHAAVVRWATAEARRAAGPCPTRDDLARRVVGISSGSVGDGARVSVVDGLGRIRVLSNDGAWPYPA